MSKTSKKAVIDGKLSKKDTLQAVVLADDFTTNLSPVQNVCPTILLPVVNAKLIDYLIETLIQSQVRELFLYCSSRIETLKDYVASKQWDDITVSLVVSDGCRSLGDALRDIDTKGWIRGDFILIRADAFANADLKNLMTLHRSKCERDKGTAMTLVLRDLGSTESSSLRQQSCVFVADKISKKLLFHKKLAKDETKINMELEWFLDHDQVEINSGFIDTHVYLCSPMVLPLFADNFDFQTIEDFIRGVLMNEEILDARIYWEKLDANQYALPINSWQAYHTLSREILQRHGYPLTPDMLPPLHNIIYMSRSTYKDRTSILSRGCRLERDTIVGKETSVGKNVFVTKSVIGDQCKINDNVKIENSYIFPNVTIEKNCKVESCVLFSNCVLENDVEIDGCILSPGVKLTSKNRYVDSFLEKNDEKVVIKKMTEEDFDFNDQQFVFYKNNDVTDCCDDLTDEGESSSDQSSIPGSPLPDDTNLFLSEVIDSLLRGFQDKLNCDNLILEINSSRYAYNVGIREVTYNVVKAILTLPLHYLTEKKITVKDANYQRNLMVMIKCFNPILMKYVKTDEAQDDCLRAIEDVATSTPELFKFVPKLIHLFYDRDFLTEERILKWFDEEEEDEEDLENRQKIKEAVTPFIQWLREAEEDDSS